MTDQELPFDWDAVPPPPTGAYIRWTLMGVPIEGIIEAIKVVPNPFYDATKNGSMPTRVEVRLNDDRILALSQLDLLDKFISASPKVGDQIKVVWTGNEKIGQGTKKLFSLAVI